MNVHVAIVDGPIDEAAARSFVERPEYGALLTFWGVVRNHHENKAVDRIDYHAYRAMAESELRQVSESAAERHDIGRLAVIHRLGVVRVGEASLLVVAGSAHRRPVFEGVLDLVDALKQRVPIWKKEYGPDGSHWVDGVLPQPPPVD